MSHRLAQPGKGSGNLSLSAFTPPALPTGVSAVAPGALTRLFALVQIIKNSGKCTDAIGADLQNTGSGATAPDLSTVQPVISAKVSGSEVGVKWGWQGQSAWLSRLRNPGGPRRRSRLRAADGGYDAELRGYPAVPHRQDDLDLESHLPRR